MVCQHPADLVSVSNMKYNIAHVDAYVQPRRPAFKPPSVYRTFDMVSLLTQRCWHSTSSVQCSLRTASTPSPTILHSYITNTTLSSNTSERLGAFGTFPLDRFTNPIHSHSPSTSDNRQWRMTSSSTTNDHHMQSFSIAIDNRMPSGLLEQDTALLETSQRTSTSIASSNGMKRKHHRLSDVVSTSDNTTDLGRNFGAYINERIPPGVTIFVLILLSIVAFILILIGTFNIPFCPIQPMIPIWLMVTGVLIIVSSTMRIVRLIPSPQNRRRNLSLDLCCHISEGLLIVSNVVWLTLGCIWVYGSRSRVHFQEYMFEEHFCDWTLYWIAFWVCTTYLILICLLIILLIVFVAIVSSKESAQNELEA